MERILRVKLGLTVYPYEYIKGYNFNDIENIMNETELPSVNKFYSNLNKKDISQLEYELAQKNWEILNCTELKDYTLKS